MKKKLVYPFFYKDMFQTNKNVTRIYRRLKRQEKRIAAVIELKAIVCRKKFGLARIDCRNVHDSNEWE
jgi:hypothetical protein